MGDEELDWLSAVAAAQLPIGTRVLTEPYGLWPGGWSRIVSHELDPGAPEIVMYVEHETEADPDEEDGRLWQIGVFDHEHVWVES